MDFILSLAPFERHLLEEVARNFSLTSVEDIDKESSPFICSLELFRRWEWRNEVCGALAEGLSEENRDKYGQDMSLIFDRLLHELANDPRYGNRIIRTQILKSDNPSFVTNLAHDLRS